jgi:hypothetical protein
MKYVSSALTVPNSADGSRSMNSLSPTWIQLLSNRK